MMVDILTAVSGCAIRGIILSTALRGLNSYDRQSLIPYAICIGFFGVSGAGLSKIRHMQNGGKRARHSVDQWDKQST